MHNKVELLSLTMGAGATLFAHELFEKIIMTAIAMIVGTTLAYYWRKHLEKKDKNESK